MYYRVISQNLKDGWMAPPSSVGQTANQEGDNGNVSCPTIMNISSGLLILSSEVLSGKSFSELTVDHTAHCTDRETGSQRPVLCPKSTAHW